jgi:SHS2 domain-containing protein
MSRRGWFQVIDHTADVAIAAGAPDLPALFDCCAAGMTSLLAEGEAPRPLSEHPIAAQGGDRPELLVDFLRQILWLHVSQRFLYAAARFDRFEPMALAGAVRGEAADPARHVLVREIKAVTYHALELDETPGRCQARVVFDV